eukprot:720387-Pleurochrysis_carterae.AAC.1
MCISNGFLVVPAIVEIHKRVGDDVFQSMYSSLISSTTLRRCNARSARIPGSEFESCGRRPFRVR